MSNRAWVTLATNDSYGLGALVLAHSLRRAASSYPTVVLITPSVTDAMRERLRAVFADVVTVDILDSRDAAHLALLQRPELGITFTKIHCWSLTQYEKCVFLDADTLVIQNCDELFEREELSAAPDVGWPDCFNSGVFVYKPSNETFEKLIKFAQERGSFDGGDQGLLNSYFSDWAHADIDKHLPFLYNVTSAAFYSYLPALKHYGQDLKIIHFIGIAKPWLQQFNWESRVVDAPDHLRELLQLWWDLFVGQVHPQLDVTMVEVQDPTPALPPHDVSQHYEPVLDPESEFPWHHPDTQPKDDNHREDIDLGEFHDPWEIYRGQIPPIVEETSTHNTFLGRVEDHEEMKKYAWEYQPQQQDYNPGPYSQEYQHQHHYQPEIIHERHETRTHYHDLEHHPHDQSTHYHHHHEPHEHHWHREQHEHEQHYENQHKYEYHNEQFISDIKSQHHNSYYEHPNTDSDHTTHHNTEKHEHQHSQNIEQIYRVHIEHETILNLQSLKSNRPEKASNEMMNGDISESESDYYEDIRPRHPYDNFYLKHRATVDANGRKICTHEIPPTPSPSLSPPPDLDPVDCPPDLITEGTSIPNVEEHSGVAGNLARVTPGASGSQREALDELTRRQGWEAGNIDYMGADSFDNIWAKISQTLSQPRVSPPKQPSPPKEPSPPIADPVVEVAQEAASIDASVPKTSAPVETQAESSVETKAKETPAVESPVAVQTAVETPVEVPVTVESASKAPEAVPAVDATDLVAPAEIPATVEAVTAVASKPQEAPEAVSSVEPSDIPATVEAASAPGEAPSDVPVSVETAAVPDVTKDEPQNTEAPALPPTPPVTPKSTPESTPVSEIAPQLEPVNVTQTEVSVPATESASESAPQVESVETPRVEVPVSVPEPTSESAPKVESDIQKEAVSAPASAPVLESAVESVEPRNEEASVPSSVPASDSAPKVETQKEEVSSAPTPALDSEPKVETQKEEVSSAPTPASDSEPKVETQTDEVSSAPTPASDSEPKVETQTEEVSSAPTPASDGEPKVESQKEEVSSTSAPASDSEPKVESQKKEVSSAPIPASDSEPKVETQKEEVSSAPSSASDSEPKVESQKEEVVTASAPASENVPQVQPVESPKEVAPVPVEAPKDPEAPATPAKPDATPERPSEAPSPAASTDSPPLANTPSKEEAPKLPAAKSEERRKVGKLQLSPPAVADPLPTPDSELEDAASLAQSIIASELRTPTVTAPAQPAPASPPLAPQEARLAVEEPEVPTPPISLAQIGVKAAPKAKPTTAAQIESSLAEKTEPASTTDQPAPKKKVVKKVKKESTAAAGSEAPVPPPRKKEKKPKEK